MRSWMRSVLAASVTTGITLVVLEVVLRLGFSRLVPPAPGATGIQYTRDTHHDYVPNSHFVRVPQPGDPYAPVVNDINRFAIRGPEPGAKPRVRLLIVGDSTVQASNIPWDRTAWELLSEHHKGCADVVSHGIASWAPTVEFAFISRRGVQFNPDQVLLVLDGNDFLPSRAFGWADEAYRAVAEYDHGVPVAFNVPLRSWRTTVHETLRRSSLFRLAETALQRRTSDAAWRNDLDAAVQVLDEPASEWPASERANVATTIDVIRAIGRFLADRHIPLRVTFVPPPYAWPDEAVSTRPASWPRDRVAGYRGLVAVVRPALEASGIRWVDLQSAFDKAKAQAPDRKLFFPIDGHWNQDAHRLVATALDYSYADVWLSAGCQSR